MLSIDCYLPLRSGDNIRAQRMVRQNCSELTESVSHHPLPPNPWILLTKRRFYILFQAMKKDKFKERIIQNFLSHYVNMPKTIYAELQTFFIDTYETAYVLLCRRIPHFLASVLTEISNFEFVLKLFYVFLFQTVKLRCHQKTITQC